LIYGDIAIRSALKRGYITGENLEALVNPASLNIRLGSTFLTPKTDRIVMLGDPVEYDAHTVEPGHRFRVGPGQFVLGTTLERLDLPSRISAFVQGRSSIGRIGLTIQNAGFVDPGFHGHITLELINESPNPIFLAPGYPIGQLVFFETGEVERPYDGKYNDQVEATGSRMYLDEWKEGVIDARG